MEKAAGPAIERTVSKNLETCIMRKLRTSELVWKQFATRCMR
jgi:hypothetical protein